jgi:hypothetical protein
MKQQVTFGVAQRDMAAGQSGYRQAAVPPTYVERRAAASTSSIGVVIGSGSCWT